VGPVDAPLGVALAELHEFVLTTVGEAYASSLARRGRLPGVAPEMFEKLFENSALGKLIYHCEDPDDPASFRLMRANAAAARAAHPRIFTHVGKTLSETSPYLMDTPIPGHYAAAARHGEVRQWVITTDARALAEKTYEAHCSPLGDGFIVVAFQDVSERCRMQQEVRRHIAELERSNRELDEFAYVASHDLKGPLQDVRNLSTWIREDLGAALPAESEQHMQKLLDRVARMERLLDDLLAYSRAGRVSAPVEELDVRALIHDVLALTQVPPGMRVVVKADIAPIRTPKAPLAQVLRNLVGNAFKHHDRSEGVVTIDVKDAGDRIELTVADDGPGIPPEFHDRVFRIFQTLRPRDAVEGSGIGLAIVKKVVESHGGSVTIDSRGSRGTTMRFTWPKESET
jgi:signal transduction histidine kinase